MNTTENHSALAPRGFRRVAPALALFFMSPFVAEFLLGDFAIDAAWLILVVGPMYGGGALVVREVSRRLGRGWPTIVLLALAYGLLEEGIVIQTLFNPNYLGLHLLQQAYLPALGIGGWWTVFVLTIHMVWSISVPIALVEALYADRRTTPWLGNIGLGVAVCLLIAGAVLVHSATAKQDPFTASIPQRISIGVLIVVITAAALRWRPSAAPTAGSVPTVWIVALATFVLGLAFMTAHMAVQGWPDAAAALGIDVAGFGLLLTWSRRAGWTSRHTLAAASGALMVYAGYGFPQEPVVGSKGTVDLIGNAVCAAIAITLLVLAWKKERSLCVSAQTQATNPVDAR